MNAKQEKLAVILSICHNLTHFFKFPMFFTQKINPSNLIAQNNLLLESLAPITPPTPAVMLSQVL